MLDIHDVHVTFNPGTHAEQLALRGVDLSAAAGEFLTVVGANGCGKSTLLGVIAGAVRPHRGSVAIGGVDVTDVPEHRRSAHVAHVFDDPRAGTAAQLDIADNLAFALGRGRRRALRPASGRTRRLHIRTALGMLRLALEDRTNDPVELLSAGQRQSLTMVMAAVTEPAILLLDEHLAALDPRTARRVRDLTAELARRLRCVTVMVTHDMREAIELGDRLLVLRDGRVAADLTGEAKRRLRPDDLADLVTSER